MAKHSKKSANLGGIVFALVMIIAVVAAGISLLGGKTVNSENKSKPQVSQSETTEEPQEAEGPKIADSIAQPNSSSIGISTADGNKDTEPEETSEEPIVDANGDRLVFGQIPQSTDNSDPNEPDVTAPAAAETPAATETPSAQTETPSSNETPASTETPSSSDGKVTTTSQVTDDWLILANKTHHLSDDYWPDDMVTVSSCVEGVGNSDTKKLRKVAADALEELIQGAADAGYKIKMRTGFRSYGYQATLFSNYASKNGEAAANKYSARAGESEHQTGLCCDVSSPSVNWAISYEYGKTEEGKWLAQHCCEYGFILRYLEGKEDITGYVYEPWHIRYVGKEVATEIFNKGICFEEYLGITD